MVSDWEVLDRQVREHHFSETTFVDNPNTSVSCCASVTGVYLIHPVVLSSRYSFSREFCNSRIQHISAQKPVRSIFVTMSDDQRETAPSLSSTTFTDRKERESDRGEARRRSRSPRRDQDRR